MYDIIIIGAGTAGLSAAIYGARAGKSVLVFEKEMYGGQITGSPEVENYPGIKMISGSEFAKILYDQAVNLGARVEMSKVTQVRDNCDIKTVVANGTEYECKSLIIATGAKKRPLGLEHEEELVGRGVSYCATCDGAFFTGKAVAVAGGGNTAIEDAIFLTEYCDMVYVVHRRDNFRAEQRLVDTLKKRGNAKLILDTNVVELKADSQLKAIVLKNTKTNELSELNVNGIFIAVGQIPQNDLFMEIVKIDDAGYVIADEDCKTNAEGIFVAGDCRTKKVRQLATAASDGAIAALAACEYLA